jgi:hypothetical protein
MDLSLKNNSLKSQNFMAQNTIDSNEIYRTNGPLYIHEPSVSFADSRDKIGSQRTPNFKPLTSQSEEKDLVEIREFSYNPSDKEGYMSEQNLGHSSF